MSVFDSLGFKQNLTKVRFPDDQAEALSTLVRDQVVALVATKDDISQLEQRLSVRIDHVEQGLSVRIGHVAQQLTARIEHGEERLRSEIKQLENAMTIKIGSMFIIAVGILLTMQGLLR